MSPNDPINGHDYQHVHTSHTVAGTPSTDTGRMTLKDLDQFVAAARSAGIPDHTEIRAQITWTGRLKHVEASS